MSWVAEHLQVILVVAGVIAYWINQRRREKEGQDADYDEDGVPDRPTMRRKIDPGQPDPEEAERSRRIQEEIRRKITERRGGQTTPPRTPEPAMSMPSPATRRPMPGPLEAPRPASTSPLEEMLRRFTDPRAEEAGRARAAAAEQVVKERQRQLEQQLRELEARQKAETDRAAVFRRATPVTAMSSRAAASAGRGLLEDLRGARTLRRAVVLREVLGPPQSLK